MKTGKLEMLLLAAGLLLTGRVIYLYQPDLLLDDAYISFRFARNFAAGLGLVYNPGEQVEGYTNFLWTLLLGLAVRLGLGIQAAAVAGSFLAALGTLGVLYLFARRWLADYPGQVWLAGMPLLLFGALGATARFVLSGIETLPFVFLVSLAFYLLLFQPRPWLAGAVFALAAMTRPEGLLYFGLAGAFALLWPGETFLGRDAKRRAGLAGELVLGFGLLYLPYFAWRYAYYGYLLPNTFYAKAQGLNLARARRGIRILSDLWAWWQVWPLMLLALAAFLPRARASLAHANLAHANLAHANLAHANLAPSSAPGSGVRPAQRFLYLGVVLATVVYFVVVGGDFIIWFGPRFLMPALPFLLLLALEGLSRLLGYLPSGYVQRQALQAGLVLGLLAASAWLSWPAHFDRLQVFAAQMRAWKELGAWMHANLPADAWIAVDAAGLIPYYSGLRTIDMYGLTDLQIAHLELSSPGSGIVAHEKFDPAYVLGRQPACIVSTWIDPAGRPLSAGLDSLDERFNEVAIDDYQLMAVAKSRGDPAGLDEWVLAVKSYRADLYAQGYLTGLYCRNVVAGIDD